ncbi:uncharacterized protein LOC126857250 [Cataglyphis hispanica]|uniref:uncharacterized protein LOC126857250 n=1 Tax=Cataglyphis hispanica TaxID=1086592 RepID=UPI0021802793|nr:uncharacterized protein LOC126857250 [Cataglyphis hispanica]
MPARRSIIGRSLAGYLAAICIVSLPTSLAQVEGRKCVCTSKACKEAGVDTCKTRFFCYTERILTTGQEIGESTVTRGCTEGATPLLCETKSWVTRSRSVNTIEPPASPRVLVPWPKLKCCDNRDYCNDADDDDGNGDGDDVGNTSTWRKTQTERTRSAMGREMLDHGTVNRDVTPMMQPDRKYDDSAESIDGLLRDRVRALHVAALVLAIAALISVLASCYVVTRFLKSNRYVMDTVNYS